MTNIRMQGGFQVLKNSTAGDDSAMKVIHAEALQVLHIEMFQELLLGRLIREHPVV